MYNSGMNNMNNNRRIDLTKKPGSIGHVMKKFRDRILAVRSSEEARDLMSALFKAENINTPRSRTIIANLSQGMSPSRTLIYLNDIIMKAAGMGVI